MLHVIFAIFICPLLLIPAECEHLELFTNHFVAEIDGGKDEASALARKYNLRLMPTVRKNSYHVNNFMQFLQGVSPHFYHFMDHRQPYLNKRPAWRVTRSLKGHSNVKFQFILQQSIFIEIIDRLSTWSSKYFALGHFGNMRMYI